MLLNNIKRLCARENISLGQLEEAARLGRNTIYKWGTSSPSVNKIKRVADYFGVTVDELLEDGE